MAVVVVEHLVGPLDTVATYSLTMTVAPSAGDLLLVRASSGRSSGARTVNSVVGCGATWARVYDGARTEYWLGSGATSAGAVVVTFSGVDTGGRTQCEALLISGLTAATVVANETTTTGTTLTGPVVTATLGQFVAASATAGAGVVTFPSTQAPAGWTAQTPLAYPGSAGGVGMAYRVPGASASHSADITSTSSGQLIATVIVLGDEDLTPSTLALNGEAAVPAWAATGSFAIEAAPLISLAGIATPPTWTPSGAISVAYSGTAIESVGLSGLSGAPLWTHSGYFSLAAEVPPIADETPVETDTDLAGSDDPDPASWAAVWTAPPGSPSAVTVGDEVAQAFGPVAMDGTEPIYAVQYARSERLRDRILVGGVDVTLFRGVRTPCPDYELVDPATYGPGVLRLPQVAASFETPGSGDLSWLRKGAPVIVDRLDSTGAVVRTDYRGWVSSWDPSGRDLTVQLGGLLTGPASMRWRPLPLFRRRTDLGYWLWAACTRLGQPFTPRTGPETGVKLFGAGGSYYLAYMSDLVAKGAKQNGNQWTLAYDETVHAWRAVVKDTSTVHFTAYVDDERVKASLRSDMSEEPNRVFASCILPSGQSVRFGVYPGLTQGAPPTFPGNLTEGSSGAAVDALIWRLVVVGELTRDESPGGFDADVTSAVRVIQRRAGLPVTGVVNAATWDALYDNTATGFTIREAQVLPAAELDAVREWNRTGSGQLSARNTAWDPTVMVVDRAVEMGVGPDSRREARSWAEDQIASGDEWVGTIETDLAFVAGSHTPGSPIVTVMSARDVRPGMNARLPLFAGGITVHVSGVSVSESGRHVTLLVDTRARPALEVWEVRQRNQEAALAPGRAWYQQQRQSTQPKDAIVPFSEIGGRIGAAVELPAQAWTVVPVVAGQEGLINRIRIRTEADPAEFAVAVFGRKVTPEWLAAVVPDPLQDKAGWSTESNRAPFEERVLLYAAGTPEEPCGYGRGLKSDGAQLTGRFDDDAGFPYFCYDQASLWLAVFADRDSSLRPGRVIWPQLVGDT